MEKRKKSRQREAILQFLSTRKDHPTADVVYENVKKTIPNISLGTVYRNLSLLSEDGTILKITCDNNADHFDATTAQHYHFYCKCCHQVSDLQIPVMENLNQEASKYCSGHIEDHMLIFHGICKKCLSNKQNSITPRRY